VSITQIQQEVCHLSEAERKQLTAWMVSAFPVLRVEDLMAQATAVVEQGAWHPQPPTEDNIPKGKTLEHALLVAARLDLLK
jgi:hypothetical protein